MKKKFRSIAGSVCGIIAAVFAILLGLSVGLCVSACSGLEGFEGELLTFAYLMLLGSGLVGLIGGILDLKQPIIGGILQAVAAVMIIVLSAVCGIVNVVVIFAAFPLILFIVGALLSFIMRKPVETEEQA